MVLGNIDIPVTALEKPDLFSHMIQNILRHNEPTH